MIQSPSYGCEKTTPKEIGETLGYIVQHMATKDDVADIRKAMATKADVHAIVRDELAPIRSELKSIRSDLDDLMGQFENVPGYRKEIDHALERIAAIEKHIGLDKKIAA
jgi:hypothetical protein